MSVIIVAIAALILVLVVVAIAPLSGSIAPPYPPRHPWLIKKDRNNE